MKAKVLFIALFILNIFQVSAQNTDEITLVVSADGATKEEATKVALRSAIEQAYGTFVSANTTILNDEMVKDEIVTISNGNIKNYSEIASVLLPNGNQSVTLRATVCISKLVSYAQSKGASIEFAGATFAMNIKMMELNKQNEMKALENLYLQIKQYVPIMYDRTINAGTPKVINDEYQVPLRWSFQANKNWTSFEYILLTTLNSLSLSQEEINNYKSMNLKVTDLRLMALNNHDYPRQLDFYLRNEREVVLEWLCDVFQLFLNEFWDIKIVDNTGYKHAWGNIPKIGLESFATQNAVELQSEDLLERMKIRKHFDVRTSLVEWFYFDYNPSFKDEIIVPKDEIMKISKFSIERNQ